MKLTPLRENILKIIKTSEVVENAASVLSKLEDKVNLTSIYRGLDYLERHRFIYSVYLSGVKYYYYPDKTGHGHFLVCTECNEVKGFSKCGVSEMQETIEKEFDYKINNHVLFFEGLCPECKRYKDKVTKISEGRK